MDYEIMFVMTNSTPQPSQLQVRLKNCHKTIDK